MQVKTHRFHLISSTPFSLAGKAPTERDGACATSSFEPTSYASTFLSKMGIRNSNPIQFTIKAQRRCKRRCLEYVATPYSHSGRGTVQPVTGRSSVIAEYQFRRGPGALQRTHTCPAPTENAIDARDQYRLATAPPPHWLAHTHTTPALPAPLKCARRSPQRSRRERLIAQ